MTTAPGDYGRILSDADGTILRFERRYEFPVDDVWDAITDPERLGRWMFSMTFESRAGGSVSIDLGKYGDAHGTVLVWEKPRHLEYKWQEPEGLGESAQATWHIRFSLRAEGDSTLLVFEHLMPDARRPEFAAGWHWYLDRLEALLGGNPPLQVETDGLYDELLVQYRETSCLGEAPVACLE